MGRNLSDDSQSPVTGRGSPRPPRREHRSSQREISPKREKRSSQAKSSRREMSLSPSPPARHRSTRRYGSPVAREKSSSHAKSPKREQSRSPSPRTKRLRRAQDDRETEKDKGRQRERETGKVSDKRRERSDGRGEGKGTRTERESEKKFERDNGRTSDKNSDRGRRTDRETREERKERKERRATRDEIDGKPSSARHEQSISPSDRHRRSGRRSRSPQPAAYSREHSEVTNSRGAERRSSDGDDSLAKMKAAEDALEANQKQQPSFELSGKLAAETNRYRGITLLFNEPPDARKPDVRWRLYVFKGGEVLNEPLYIHRQSCYLFGRERRVADIPTDHPSCSKQHAVIQYRQIEKEQPDGTLVKQVRPYVMDLGSTNKTFINENPIEPQRYYELFEKDTIKFGNSSREYVLLHENSAQ